MERAKILGFNSSSNKSCVSKNATQKAWLIAYIVHEKDVSQVPKYFLHLFAIKKATKKVFDH